MGTINSAFSLISGALNADQSALSIAANNVANANTPGYTTEIPNWQENPPVTIGGVSYGDGVTETGPPRSAIACSKSGLVSSSKWLRRPARD